ncbi:hypothetical protein F3K43_34880 [Streptomyces sp. LBUM 1476]|nr:hypothetical protein [Streptomyces sp. LBUM 1476]
MTPTAAAPVSGLKASALARPPPPAGGPPLGPPGPPPGPPGPPGGGLLGGLVGMSGQSTLKTFILPAPLPPTIFQVSLYCPVGSSRFSVTPAPFVRVRESESEAVVPDCPPWGLIVQSMPWAVSKLKASR